MDDKVYRMLGIETAVNLLRPGAKWEITNGAFTRWEDPRPCPTIDEVYATMDKIKAFEDSIPTIWTDEQLTEMAAERAMIEGAIG